MAYVSVPKDLTKVKNKVAFNLTKRQLICIAAGAAAGIPFYFLTRGVLGNSNAATIMVLLMLPAFLFAMYEKDGMHLEEVLIHMIRVKWLRPAVRKYETENYFETDPGKSVSVTVKNRRREERTLAERSGKKRRLEKRRAKEEKKAAKQQAALRVAKKAAVKLHAAKQIRRRKKRKGYPHRGRLPIRKWQRTESAGCMINVIPKQSGFRISIISWLRTMTKMRSLRTGAIF